MKHAPIAAAGALALVAAALAWAGLDRRLESRPPAERPELLLLTGLPLAFAESFGLEQPGSPALTRLEQRYAVRPIAVADAASLAGHRLLLMAQPRAQPAEALVALDAWVRGGGHLLLLADPKLDWPSERPLGDLSRPPLAFADTGLLGYWGLTLRQPGDGESAGTLASENGPCELVRGALAARCRIGAGVVTVIADADFLNVSPDQAGRIDPLIDELERLEHR